MKTVREHYNITEDDMDNLEERACCNKYMADSRQFLNRVINTPVDALTDGQKTWVENIMDAIQ